MDIDSSYTYLKHKELTDYGVGAAPLEQPTCAPLSGWQGITKANVNKETAKRMPQVTSFCVVS